MPACKLRCVLQNNHREHLLLTIGPMASLEGNRSGALTRDPWKGLQRDDVDLENLVAIASAVLLAAVALVAYSGKAKQAGKTAGGASLPPGPRPWPIIGNLQLLGSHPHEGFTRLSKKYGPILFLRLGSMKVVVLSSSEAARELLTKHDKAVAARPNFTQFKVLTYESQAMSTAPYGPYWGKMRKFFSLELMTPRVLRQFQENRKKAVFYLLETVLNDCKEENILQISPRLSNAGNDIMSRMIINKQFYVHDSTASDLREPTFHADTFAELLILVNSLDPGDFIPLLSKFDVLGYKKRMGHVRTATDKIYATILEERRKNWDPTSEPKDLLDLLLAGSLADDKAPMSDDQIKIFLQDIIVAATLPTATSTEWALAELLKNPNTLKRAQDELDAVIGRDRVVEESDLSRLPYLVAVVKETLRLHPPLPILLPRRSTEPIEIQGCHIPTGSTIFINAWAIGRDASAWNNAHQFSPERFIDSPVDNAGRHFELLSFGSGRRGCPGRPLGLTVIQHMLAALLHAFDWRLPPGCSPETLSMDERPGPAPERHIPLQAVASLRLSPAVLSGISRI